MKLKYCLAILILVLVGCSARAEQLSSSGSESSFYTSSESSSVSSVASETSSESSSSEVSSVSSQISSAKPSLPKSSASKSEVKSVEGFFNYLRQKGFTVSKGYDRDPAAIGATESACYKVNDIYVDVAKLGHSTPLGVYYYDNAVRDGTITLVNSPIPVTINGDLVLFGNSNDQIREAFLSY